MKPRKLRHRLEKAAKLLVIVQKYFPDCDCRIADEKGDNGHLIVHLTRTVDPAKMGLDFESKGFNFSKAHNPWLGLITYKGTKGDQPTVLIEVETVADRLYQGSQTTQEEFSFKEEAEQAKV